MSSFYYGPEDAKKLFRDLYRQIYEYLIVFGYNNVFHFDYVRESDQGGIYLYSSDEENNIVLTPTKDGWDVKFLHIDSQKSEKQFSVKYVLAIPIPERVFQ